MQNLGSTFARWIMLILPYTIPWVMVSCQSAPKTPEDSDAPVVASDTKDSSEAETEIKNTAENQIADPQEGDTAFLEHMGFASDQAAYVLWDPSNRKIISAYQPELAMRPASVSKIFTAVMGLAILGPEYRFSTLVLRQGSIEGDTVKGHILLKGMGDPFLTAGDLMNMVESLQSQGIKKISGNFYYQAAEWPEREYIAEGFLEEATYNPGISSLSSEFNRFQLRRHSSGSQKNSHFSLPEIESIQIKKDGQRFDPSVRFMRQRKGDKDVWQLSNSRRYEMREELPVRQSSRTTAELFQQLAIKSGIDLPKPQALPSTMKDSGFQIVHNQLSLPLSKLIDMTMEYSNNVMAELIYLTASKKVGMNAEQWLKKSIKGWNWRDVSHPSGSGISLENRASPIQIVAALDYALKMQTEWKSTSLQSLMPISAWKGPLLNRFTQPEQAFRVWAKTGSIDYVSGLAGYLLTRSNQKYLFAILINDHRAREAYQTANPELANLLRNRARKWNARAQSLQDRWVRHWMENH